MPNRPYLGRTVDDTIAMYKELVNYIDKNFTTKAERGGRAVTGLSMGGHGSKRLLSGRGDREPG